MKKSRAFAILDDLYQHIGESSLYNRRAPLIENMQSLESKGIDCKQCPGYCCTFEYNSMRITPLEALELYTSLEQEGKLTSSFWAHNQATIKKYRLDHEVTDGRGRVVRRYYTCSLFKHESLGCSASPYFKPIGCLGFNAIKPGTRTREECRSNEATLEHAASIKAEQVEKLNKRLSEKFNIYWSKESIPMALEHIHKIVS